MAGVLLILPAAPLPEPVVLAVDLLAEAANAPAPDLASLLPPPEPAEPVIYPNEPPAPPPTLADLLVLPAPDALPPPDLTPRPPAVRPASRPVPPLARAPVPVASAPAALPGPVAAAPAAPPSPDRIAAWMAALGAWIDTNRRYPPEARLRAEQGVTTIRFAFDAEGLVTEAAIVTPSGSAALDAATLAMMQGARIPVPPEGLEEARRRVTVPIRYRLN